MTISKIDITEAAHERAEANQGKIRRRINSSLSALFGTGFVATVAVTGLDMLPLWALIVVAALLAVAEVLCQAFSKASLAPSQRGPLAAAAAEIEAEANPEPTATDLRLADLADSVATVQQQVGILVENRELESAAAETTGMDPDEDLRRAYDGL